MKNKRQYICNVSLKKLPDSESHLLYEKLDSFIYKAVRNLLEKQEKDIFKKL